MLQCQTQVLCADLIARRPLVFEASSLLCHGFGDPLHDLGNKTIRLLNDPARFVHERGLDRIPAL